ncbi:unnamed protein product [Miscanthus lutarioriparius]|uniref:Uncharacterized protein n=1 Tax=Miscanthus lutarioriparius TaxID=422564 RepID=A0A811PBJ1_9POAL|nr:unnamed protein product [Miscanthus lutarioriparius]
MKAPLDDTQPKSVAYEQNPLSIYYCYDSAGQGQDGELRMCNAEVTNTPWAERVMFTFQPGSDLVAKPLHVSPFMDMLSNWSFHWSFLMPLVLDSWGLFHCSVGCQIGWTDK